MSVFWPLHWLLALFILAVVNSGRSSRTPDADNGDPQFTSAIGNVTVPLGREAILTCAVTDLGNYRVGWIKVEDQTILTLHTKVVTHNPRILLTHDNYHSWQLHIRQVKESDQGCYMCQVNTSIMKKQIGCLDVHVPPDIVNEGTSGDMTVAEGDNATLSCRAQGHPIPRILWRREDGEHIILRKPARGLDKVETFSGEQLTLERVDRKQMGAYLCIASNDVPPAVSKRIILNVNFEPTIKVPNQLLGSPLEADVQIECLAEAFPNTINYWLKNRSEMLLHGNKYWIEEVRDLYRVKLKLTVRDLTKNDLGSYTCVATNSLGKSEGTVRLYEIKIPTLPPTTTTTTTTSTSTTTTTTTENPTTLAEVSSIMVHQQEDLYPFVTGTLEDVHSNEVVPHPSSGRHSDAMYAGVSSVLKPFHVFLVLFILLTAVVCFS